MRKLDYKFLGTSTIHSPIVPKVPDFAKLFVFFDMLIIGQPKQ